ncbi:hypothetical protein B0A55_10338, partial [Friedmanniomyces simplex]
MLNERVKSEQDDDFKYRPARWPTVNQARAMRVAEIMNDYRNIQNFMAAIRASPSAEEYNEEGYL